MEPNTLLTLVVGAVTALGTLGGSAVTAYWAFRNQRWREEFRAQEERLRRQEARTERRASEARSRFDEARRAVLQLGMTARVVAHVRTAGPPQSGDGDLAELMRQARSDCLEAAVAVERLRGVLPSDSRGHVDALREATDRAFSQVQTGAGQVEEAVRVQRALGSDLRALEELLFPVPGEAGRGGHGSGLEREGASLGIGDGRVEEAGRR